LSIFSGLLGDRKEARAVGHKTYFGGYKCLKGHLSPRLISNAKCCACISIEKAKKEAAYVRGLERGRAPELARKAAEREAKEKLKEEQRATRRATTAKAQRERSKERAKEKRKVTLAAKKVALPSAAAPLLIGGAPWE
jgi:hypothetical protein